MHAFWAKDGGRPEGQYWPEEMSQVDSTIECLQLVVPNLLSLLTEILENVCLFMVPPLKYRLYVFS